MEKAYLSLQQVLKEKEFGMKAKELNGMTKIMKMNMSKTKMITINIEMKIEICLILNLKKYKYYNC